MRLVIALGGNVLLPDTDAGQEKQVRAAVHDLAPLFAEHEVVLTHGNGPQVGNLLLQAEQTGQDMPLDVLVAETQAQIGYLLQQEIRNQTGDAFATIVTQVVVDEDDAGFDDPTKPVGSWYTGDEARNKPFPVKEVGDGTKSWRRVVPSPAPIEIVEQDVIQALVEQGQHVICCGGGGIPVVRDSGLHGVPAVIDKDAASQVLATGIDADRLLLLTDEPYAYTDYGAPDQEPVKEADVDTMKTLLADGEFGAGSMRPKVEACITFIADGGKQAVITSPDNAAAAVQGDTGTRVVP